MATIVNTPNSGSGGVGGWVIAGALIIVAALVALFVWPGYATNTAAPQPTQVNVQIPALDSGGAGGGEATQ